jgi:regulator of protease activity HflC (stomatin/prohibitin superfamily)
VSVLRDYAGNPFEKLILPRVQEATKEATALKTAADIVKTREQIKASALATSRDKIGSLLIIEDLVIEDIALSRELEQAIEAKMVQQQEAEKAIFKMQQARTDAETDHQGQGRRGVDHHPGRGAREGAQARRAEDGREVERCLTPGGRRGIEHHAAARKDAARALSRMSGFARSSLRDAKTSCPSRRPVTRCRVISWRESRCVLAQVPFSPCFSGRLLPEPRRSSPRS